MYKKERYLLFFKKDSSVNVCLLNTPLNVTFIFANGFTHWSYMGQSIQECTK